jgi:steroid 5-alpha reductase family enzyme
MGGLWSAGRKTKNYGVVDLGWTAGVGLVAVAYAAFGTGAPGRRVLLALLAGGWSFRLAYYILTDRIMHSDEDGRYQRMRAHWGERADRNFFWFFEAQSLLIVIFALPFLPIVQLDAPLLRVWDLAAVAVWIIAVGGETLADRQLTRFRRNPENRGKTCRAGLWRYSRHPNYFFEWLHWWTYVLLGVGASLWWLTLIGPVLMLLFLFRLTGIPYTEKQALASRGENYRRYQETTSAFIPWPPKKDTL